MGGCSDGWVDKALRGVLARTGGRNKLFFQLNNEASRRLVTLLSGKPDSRYLTCDTFISSHQLDVWDLTKTTRVTLPLFISGFTPSSRSNSKQVQFSSQAEMEKTPRSATPASSPFACPNPTSRPSSCSLLPSPPPFREKKKRRRERPGAISDSRVSGLFGRRRACLGYRSKPISGRIDYEGEYRTEFRVLLGFRVAKVGRSPLNSTSTWHLSLKPVFCQTEFFLHSRRYNTGNGQPRLPRKY